jgi:hypothetical protein
LIMRNLGLGGRKNIPTPWTIAGIIEMPNIYRLKIYSKAKRFLYLVSRPEMS